MVKKKLTKKQKEENQKKEIIWNIINSFLAGALVFLGTITDGEITEKGIIIAVSASAIIAINKFNDYWSKEENEYCNTKCIGNFL